MAVSKTDDFECVCNNAALLRLISRVAMRDVRLDKPQRSNHHDRTPTVDTGHRPAYLCTPQEGQITGPQPSPNGRLVSATAIAIATATVAIAVTAACRYDWLNRNSGAVQAISTVVLIGVTAIYAVLTYASADAATRQANAAERQASLLLSEHKEQFEFAPQIVSEAIMDTKALIAFWKR